MLESLRPPSLNFPLLLLIFFSFWDKPLTNPFYLYKVINSVEPESNMGLPYLMYSDLTHCAILDTRYVQHENDSHNRTLHRLDLHTANVPENGFIQYLPSMIYCRDVHREKTLNLIYLVEKSALQQVLIKR